MAVAKLKSNQISLNEESNSKKIGSFENYISNITVFYNSSELSDVTLKVGKKRFYAHKFLLAVHSEVFRAMFSESAWMESKQHDVTLEENEECFEVFGEFVKFLYSGQIAVNNDNLVALYRLADKYNVRGLLVLCEQFIRERVEATDFKAALSWLSFAEEYQLQSIVVRLYDVLRIHFQKVIASSMWVTLQLRQICHLLDSWKIVVEDEYTVYQGVLKWIKKQIRGNGKNTPPDTVYEPLRYIRPAYLTPDQLIAIEKSGGSFSSAYRQSIHTLIFDGYRYHSLRKLEKYAAEFSSVQYHPRLYTISTYSTPQNIASGSTYNFYLSLGCKNPAESGSYWSIQPSFQAITQKPATEAVDNEIFQSYSISPKINEPLYVQYYVTASTASQPGWNYHMAVICYDPQNPNDVLHVVTSNGKVPSGTNKFTMASPANFAGACAVKAITVIHAWN